MADQGLLEAAASVASFAVGDKVLGVYSNDSQEIYKTLTQAGADALNGLGGGISGWGAGTGDALIPDVAGTDVGESGTKVGNIHSNGIIYFGSSGYTMAAGSGRVDWNMPGNSMTVDNSGYLRVISGGLIAWSGSSTSAATGVDTSLSRPESGTIAMANATQEFRIHNTTGVNAEYVDMGWKDGANVFTIGAKADGSGTVRAFEFTTGNSNGVKINDLYFGTSMQALEGITNNGTGNIAYLARGKHQFWADNNNNETGSLFEFHMKDSSGTGTPKVTFDDAGNIESIAGIGLHGVTAPAQAAHIGSPSADTTSLKTAVDDIIAVLENMGATALS